MSSRSASVPHDDPQRVIQDYETRLAGTPAPLDDVARAATLVDLGWACRSLQGRDRGENLRRAIRCFDDALRIYNVQSHPREWGRALYRRGVACAELPDSGDDGLREAIACFTHALEVHTRERYPELWARLHGKLGLAHAQLALGDRETNLRTAVGHYELALQHYSRESDPVRWARVHCNLATAREELSVITGDRGSLNPALESLEFVLTVYRPDTHPVEYARLSSLAREWRDRQKT